MGGASPCCRRRSREGRGRFHGEREEGEEAELRRSASCRKRGRSLRRRGRRGKERRKGWGETGAEIETSPSGTAPGGRGCLRRHGDGWEDGALQDEWKENVPRRRSLRLASVWELHLRTGLRSEGRSLKDFLPRRHWLLGLRLRLLWACRAVERCGRSPPPPSSAWCLYRCLTARRRDL